MTQRDIVTTKEAAKLARVTEKTIRQWVRDGMPAVERHTGGAHDSTRIDLRDLYQWHLEHVPQDPLDAERTRLAREQADKQALDNAVRRGELGELAAWRSEIETLFGEIRAQLLAIPTKEAPQLDGNVNQRKERLEQVVREVLSRFATYRPGDRTEPGAAGNRRRGGGIQSAAEADGVGMGRPQSKAVARDKRRAR